MYTIQEMIRVSKMYYELKMTQQEIAEKENISRPTVSRILDNALKEGIVSFVINYPLDSVSNLAAELKETFDLQHVFVAPVYVEDNHLILRDVGKGLSSYLSSIIKDRDVLGISWGNTLTYVSSSLEPMNKREVKVVQLNGSVSTTSHSTGSMGILDQFSKVIPAQPYMLPVPAIVDSDQIATAIMQDSSVKEIISMGKTANIAVFGIGKTSYDSILYKAGYFSEVAYGELLNKGAVGDILSRFYNIYGGLCDDDLNNRTIGLQLEDLKGKDHSIAISCGEEKASAILGALNGNYINTLFTDENTAKAVLKLYRKGDTKNESVKVI
ncbi:sugar-binding transcriptional regulator [Aneurinibacillus terranovensis]|uniref:sugar-binding transcriptional regulator n=1 Tax=Aneurinibacillus terranovensis TaxID=278991 RepID=UPI0006885E24|nr:sugar-binding transcriptional regulator [Aneurinibacillus terranovensis]